MERATHGTTALVAERVEPRWADAHISVAGFLAGYSGSTREGHARELRLWANWCHNHGLGILDVLRPHLEMYANELDEVRHLKRSTVAHKMSVICGYYKWCALEGVLERDPVANVRRPKVEYITTRQYMDRMELARFLQYASMGSPRDHALCNLLALNGLRISEALGADVDDLSFDKNHRLLHIVGKGRKEAQVPLAPPTLRALLTYLDGRQGGPLFLGAEGGRMNRHAAARIVKRVSKKAGITKHLSPHSLRHSFITAALDAGVPLRDVQHAARHADPRTTSYYDHGRKSFDSHATYIVSAFVAGG